MNPIVGTRENPPVISIQAVVRCDALRAFAARWNEVWPSGDGDDPGEELVKRVARLEVIAVAVQLTLPRQRNIGACLTMFNRSFLRRTCLDT
jgi:hypothetical protein